MLGVPPKCFVPHASLGNSQNSKCTNWHERIGDNAIPASSSLRCCALPREKGEQPAFLILGLLANAAELVHDDVNELWHEIFVREGDAFLIRLGGKVRLLADPPADEDVAARDGFGLAALRVGLLSGRAHDANVSDLYLAARVWAACPVDA